MTEIMENTVDLEKIKKEVIKDEIVNDNKDLKEELICLIDKTKEVYKELSLLTKQIIPLIAESVRTVHNTYRGKIKEIVLQEKEAYQGIKQTLDIRVAALEREIHEIKNLCKNIDLHR